MVILSSERQSELNDSTGVQKWEQEIVAGKYGGFEKRCAKKLHRSFPNDLSFEDALATVRVFSVEACRKYNPLHNSGAKFGTFLYRHLFMSTRRELRRLYRSHGGEYSLLKNPPTRLYCDRNTPTHSVAMSEFTDSLSSKAFEALSILNDTSLNFGGRSKRWAISNYLGISNSEANSLIREMQAAARKFLL